MSAVFFCFERASVFGLAALSVALGAQWLLDGRAPASWRVWLWRVALLQTTLALLPWAPVAIAVLPPSANASLTAPVHPLTAPTHSLRAPTRSAPLVNGLAPSPIRSAPSPTDSLRVPTRSAPLGNQLAPSRNDSPPSQLRSAEPEPSAPPFRARFWAIRVALALYALGVSVQCIRLARSFRRVQRTLRACAPIEDEAQIETELRALAEKMGVSRVPRLLVLEDGAPFLVGVFRPSIVLPRALLVPESRELEAVLSHELAHQRRRDLAWNALLWAMETLFWFHPLAWMARRFLALEVESACDEMVLSSTRITPRLYAALLLGTMNTQHTPLTAGVADGFVTLRTRLLRLNRAPKRPHLPARLAFVASLCLAFGALIPFRFVARAQMVAPVSKSGTTVSGTVIDSEGKPVAGATVYEMRRIMNGQEPLETTVSDARGEFKFKAKQIGELELLADAGVRGSGFARSGRDYYFIEPGEKVRLKVSDSARVRLRFLDEAGKAVPNLKVRLWRTGPTNNYWLALPKAMLASMKATTNARGEADFPPLPANLYAQFILDEEYHQERSRWRFAPLSDDDIIVLQAPRTSQTIRLLAPATIEGKVSVPDGQSPTGAMILAGPLVSFVQDGQTRFGAGSFLGFAKVDASGHYSISALRPGRYALDVFAGEKLRSSWLGPFLRSTLKTGRNIQNITLSRGALIQGVVLAQSTGKPVKGQTMLCDSTEDIQAVQTDARGYFRFRVRAGQGTLIVHANGTNSPPPGFILPAKSSFDFALKDGEKREFKIEMPGTPVVKPTTGTVVGPDGKGVAGAGVLYRMAGSRNDYGLHKTKTDADGKFSLPAKWSAVPVQLFADAGELTTAHSTIALPGEKPTLSLEANTWASVEGRVTDENKKPLARANIQLYTFVGQTGISAGNLQSDANGRFHAEHLRPDTGFWAQCHLAGFQEIGGTPQTLKSGQHLVLNLSMRRAAATLSGRVVGEDGKPARGFQIGADGYDRPMLTRADGKFFLSQVFSGPISVYVYAPNNTEAWINLEARGGEKNLVIRLSKAHRQSSLMRRYYQPNPHVSAALVGKTAPEIRAARWKDGKAQPLSSLRGKVVFLNFGDFDWNINHEVEDFARSFATRLQVVGIQISFPRPYDLQTQAPFPVALDAPPSNNKANGFGGQTFALYGNAQYVVIGRDGKIVYAGDELDRALSFAASALR